MRRAFPLVSLATLVSLCASGAAAQVGAPPPPEDEARAAPICEVESLPNAGAPMEPGFFSVHLASPRPGHVGVPTNVQLVLAGFIQDLDAEPPFLEIALIGPDETEVPLERAGALARPAGELLPHTDYRFEVRGVDGDCFDCFGESGSSFTTGAGPDHAAPALFEEPEVHAFVFSAEHQACGFTQRHGMVGRIGGLGTDVARISVSATIGNATATKTNDVLVHGAEASFSSQGDAPLALGDHVHVAVTPIDLAGNTGDARVVRVSAQALLGEGVVPAFEDFELLQCTLHPEPAVDLPEALPTNGRIVARYGIEPIPLALRDGDDVIPLHPVDHLDHAQVLEPAQPLPANRTLDLVSLPCPHCTCPGCVVDVNAQVRTSAAADTTAPEAPRLLELREDLDPAPASGDSCHDDRTALVAILAAGVDDAAAAWELRYDAVLRLEGKLAVDVGRALPAVRLDDERVAVRLRTQPYGRLLSETFELELVAKDLADNASGASFPHDPLGSAGGCAQAGGGSSGAPLWALLTGLGLAALRRRRATS
jgi:hypothetical protein